MKRCRFLHDGHRFTASVCSHADGDVIFHGILGVHGNWCVPLIVDGSVAYFQAFGDGTLNADTVSTSEL